MKMLKKVSITPQQIDWSGLSKRFMNRNELETICTILNQIKPKTVMETGINVGRTAKAILREVEGIETYIGVDVLPGYVTEKVVQRKEIPAQAGELVVSDKRVKLFVTEKGSYDLSEDDLPELDAVFIDGDHSWFGVEKDTKLALSKVRKGGVIIWHDYHNIGTVDVRDYLHSIADKYPIKHVEGTWLAYMIVE